MSRKRKQLVICLKNDGYAAALERRKVYVVLHDDTAAKHGLIRIVDESGEDYLYPADFFAAVELPASVRRAVLKATA